MGGRFGDYIRWVDSRLFMLSCLATYRFGLTVVISQVWILVVLIRIQTSFAVVVSGVGLNVKQRTYSACAYKARVLLLPLSWNGLCNTIGSSNTHQLDIHKLMLHGLFNYIYQITNLNRFR